MQELGAGTPDRDRDPAPVELRQAPEKQSREKLSADQVEEASKESFPASDAPSWSPLHPGAPGEHPDGSRPEP